jgi:hypothetical protein
VSVLLLLATSAAAAPVDAASDHVLIRAYQTFLTGVLSDVPAWRQADSTYISNTSASCSNVLAAVNLLPSNQVNHAAAAAFGEEAGGDLLVSLGPPILHRLSRLQKSISNLPWSTRKAKTTVTGYLRSEKALYSLAPSDLCADATALAGSNAETTPPGTLQWLATLGRRANRNIKASGAFGSLLGTYHSSGDTGTLNDVLKLLKRWESLAPRVLGHELTKLLTALGLTI